MDAFIIRAKYFWHKLDPKLKATLATAIVTYVGTRYGIGLTADQAAAAAAILGGTGGYTKKNAGSILRNPPPEEAGEIGADAKAALATFTPPGTEADVDDDGIGEPLPFEAVPEADKTNLTRDLNENRIPRQ